jgi:hypothetical protein
MWAVPYTYSSMIVLSGLMLPSSVGPLLLHEGIVTFFIPPAVIIFLELPGRYHKIIKYLRILILVFAIIVVTEILLFITSYMLLISA